MRRLAYAGQACGSGCGSARSTAGICREGMRAATGIRNAAGPVRDGRLIDVSHAAPPHLLTTISSSALSTAAACTVGQDVFINGISAWNVVCTRGCPKRATICGRQLCRRHNLTVRVLGCPGTFRVKNNHTPMKVGLFVTCLVDLMRGGFWLRRNALRPLVSTGPSLSASLLLGVAR